MTTLIGDALSSSKETSCETAACRPIGTARYLPAQTSAVSMRGLLVRALRLVLRIFASRKPADRNSSRKASPSLAPAIQRNQLSRLQVASAGRGSFRISSAAQLTCGRHGGVATAGDQGTRAERVQFARGATLSVIKGRLKGPFMPTLSGYSTASSHQVLDEVKIVKVTGVWTQYE